MEPHKCLRIVLDTNVLVAAAYAPGSASRKIVDACLAGRCEALTCEALNREYDFILARAIRRGGYEQHLANFIAGATKIAIEAIPRVVPDDPDDDKLVALGEAGGAAAIVTSDQHLLGLQLRGPCEVLTATQFAERWLR